MSPFRFARAFLLWLAGFALLAVMLGVYADPYAMFGTGTQPKPRVYQQADIAKVYAMARVRPKTLLLGNSRTEAGFDPESPAFPAAARPVFNGGRAGVPLSTSLLTLQEAISLGGLRTVIVGVDYQEFVLDGDAGPSPAELRRARGDILQVALDALTSTLTLDAVMDSLTTIARRGDKDAPTMTAFGFNPRHESALAVRREGHRALFDSNAADLDRRYANERPPEFSDPSQHQAFQNLTKIINLARENGVHVVVFIHPYHQMFLDLFQRFGYAESFAEWKDALRAVAGDVHVYDFAVYDSRTEEPVPERGNTKPMRYYWEQGHYRSAFGDEIIRAMSADLVPADQTFPDN